MFLCKKKFQFNAIIRKQEDFWDEMFIIYHTKWKIWILINLIIQMDNKIDNLKHILYFYIHKYSSIIHPVLSSNFHFIP